MQLLQDTDLIKTVKETIAQNFSAEYSDPTKDNLLVSHMALLKLHNVDEGIKDQNFIIVSPLKRDVKAGST